MDAIEVEDDPLSFPATAKASEAMAPRPGTDKPILLPAPRLIPPAPEVPPIIKIAKSLTDTSHRLWFFRGIVYCANCGNYADVKPRALLVKCPGKAGITKYGKEVLASIHRGVPPTGLDKWPLTIKESRN